jgi:hypothetical protein
LRNALLEHSFAITENETAIISEEFVAVSDGIGQNEGQAKPAAPAGPRGVLTSPAISLFSYLIGLRDA